MSKEKLYNFLILVIISFGVILRVTVFWVSPPNNGYDDHLEVIHIYSQELHRPAPFQCWECYQPPLYYYTAAITFNVSRALGGSEMACWKAVQGINPLLSILLLIIAYQILLLFKLNKLLIAITLSFLVALPRDIFTSAMIGNDYMLVFFSILALFLFLKTLIAIKTEYKVRFWYTVLVIVTLLSAMTKQHGLILLLFPGVLFLMLFRKAYRPSLYWALPVLIVGIVFSLSDEIWKYKLTGKILVSNQHYFNYAENQYPGSLEKVEFLTFRVVELYSTPFISESTAASIFTELFARTFYDYEWRFISPKSPLAQSLGQFGYSLGLIWVFFYSSIIISFVKQFRMKALTLDNFIANSKLTPIIISFCFILVPFLQTLRFPYFSSMKSMFMLSGIITLILIIGSWLKSTSFTKKIGVGLIIVNLVYISLIVVHISLYLEKSLKHLHGPLWPIP
jgi:hypothetical protein